MCFDDARGLHTGPQHILLCRDVVTLGNALQVVQVAAGREENRQDKRSILTWTSNTQNCASSFSSPSPLLQAGASLGSPISSQTYNPPASAPSTEIAGVHCCACCSRFSKKHGLSPLVSHLYKGTVGLWLCDPSSRVLNLTCIQRGVRMFELQVKSRRGKLVLQGEIKMLIGVIKVPTQSNLVWSFIGD